MQKMKFLLFVLYMFAIQFLFGCASSHKTVRLVNNPPCSTKIEAVLHSEGLWYNKFPAIVVNTPDGERTYFGEFVGIEKNGIRFNPKGLSIFQDYPERLYSYDEIVCAVNDDAQVVYGGPPSALSMDIQLIPESGGRPIQFTLRSKIATSICLEPGRYQIAEVQFWNGYKYRDECVSMPRITIDIKPDKVNYIGEFYLDDSSIVETDTVIELPFEVQSNLVKRRGFPVLFVGRGGLSGAGAAVRVNYRVRESGTHVLVVKPGNLVQDSEQNDKVHTPLNVGW